MKNRAFTLLELLVVITIIGILASVVVVSMSGSTDSATIAKGKAYSQQVHALLGHEAVGVWNFDEGEGDTVYDILGYGNHGTFVGDTHFVDSDIGGYALSFDGTGDYVDCGEDESLNIIEAITIETWVKINSLDNTWRAIIEVTPHFPIKQTTENKIRFQVNTVNGSNNILFTSPKIETWYHLSLTYDNNNLLDGLIAYVDGIRIGNNNTNSGFLSSITSVWKISNQTAPPTQSFNGLIDNVRIYSAALPSAEIQKHYVQGLERLLANQAITQVEYDQRMEEFNKSLASI
jgi:prepilin-type N-terminal cleavage/methylation domain-containing protein